MAEKIDPTLEHFKVLRAESRQTRDDLTEVKQHVIVVRNQMADILKGTCVPAQTSRRA